jgi:hypothetical protein
LFKKDQITVSILDELLEFKCNRPDPFFVSKILKRARESLSLLSSRHKAILAGFLAAFLMLSVCPTFARADLNDWQADLFHHLRDSALPFAVSGISLAVFSANIKSSTNQILLSKS